MDLQFPEWMGKALEPGEYILDIVSLSQGEKFWKDGNNHLWNSVM